MTRRATWLVYGGLVVAAAVSAFWLRSAAPAVSELASVDNAGATGLKALFVFLERSGLAPRRLEQRLDAPLSAEIRVLVIAGPVAETVDPAEVEALATWVRGGGALVYFATARAAEQRHLAEWLGLEEGPFPEDPQDTEGDFGGVPQAVVPWASEVPSTWTLRVSNRRGIRVEDAQPVVRDPRSTYGWRRTLGDGEIWVFANPSMIENRRLAQANNLDFIWWVAQQGSIAFDEWHQHARVARPVSPGLGLLALQLVLSAGLIAWAFGTRMGPARPRRVERHRSPLEYVQSLAWLFRKHGVEPALISAMAGRLRRLAHERVGTSLQAGPAELALALSELTQMTVTALQRLFEDVEAAAAAEELTARQFHALDLRVVEVEQALAGPRRTPRAP